MAGKRTKQHHRLLKEIPSEENLWQSVIAFQDYPFKTATGLPFRYKLKIGKNGEYEKLSKYREGESYEERGYFEHAELQINYDIRIDKLTELYFSDLKKMKFKYKTQDPLRNLDTLYRNKGLI